jgi:translation initiation factor IF-3
VNERIRAREVRLIDENGAQLGIMATREALRVARERELDLIEVAPNAQPPVCRIMDYGKHKDQQAKREREAHKRSKPTEVRLLRLKPQIGPHDLEIKLRKLRELLGDGNKVRINLRFRGREVSHPELGSRLLNRVAEHLADVALTEMPPRFEGRMMNMMLAPKPHARPPAPVKPSAPPREAPVVEAAAAPTQPAKAVPDVQAQVQQKPVEQPLRQNEDAEDSGEAG